MKTIVLAGLLLAGLSAGFVSCGSDKQSSGSASAALAGRWQFRRRIQIVHLGSGEVVETIRQEPPQASERFLEVTADEFITHYAPPAASNLPTAKTASRYLRQGSTLLISLYPAIEQRPLRIQYLSADSLVLHFVFSHKPGAPYTEISSYYTR